jgi:hypothetical protein
VRIDGVRHDVHILAPERLVKEIEAFLDGERLSGGCAESR